jgi:hypothetical protein
MQISSVGIGMFSTASPKFKALHFDSQETSRHSTKSDRTLKNPMIIGFQADARRGTPS